MATVSRVVAYLEGVMQHKDDLVVVVRDRHLEVQSIELAEVPVQGGGERQWLLLHA